MPAYITATGAISPQKTFDPGFFLEEVTGEPTLHLKCMEPDYYAMINPVQLRRMPRILKMGLGASRLCLNEAGINNPGAIIVGTAFGCIEELEKFMFSVNDNNEQTLSPTPFIQSTHNIVGAQIAVMLKNKNYNLTYCQRGFSFERALMDAVMLFNEGEADTALVGGLDEATANYCTIQNHLHYWKNGPVNNLDLLKAKTPGTIAGEGAAFFMLAKEKSAGAYAAIKDIHTFYKPGDITETGQEIAEFLLRNGLGKEKPDMVILGNNGDSRYDPVYNHLCHHYFNSATTQYCYYKHLCGEYPTSTAFAVWLAAKILKRQTIPEIVRINNSAKKEIRDILIYNHYQNRNHSLIYLTAV